MFWKTTINPECYTETYTALNQINTAIKRVDFSLLLYSSCSQIQISIDSDSYSKTSVMMLVY